MSNALEGKRIVVTRQYDKSNEMVQSIEALGGMAYVFPVIQTVASSNTVPISKALQAIQQFDWIIFTSTNGVDYFFEFLLKEGLSVQNLQHMKIVTVGPITAESIKNRGLNVYLIPDHFIAEALLEKLEDEMLLGEKVLIPRGNIARETIPVALRNKGIDVTEITVYDTVPENEKNSEELLTQLRERNIDVITFTSSSTVRHFLKAIGDENMSLVENVLIACIGPKTAETAQELGLQRIIISQEYTIEGIIKAISNL